MLTSFPLLPMLLLLLIGLMRAAARNLCLTISTGFDKIALVFSRRISCLLLIVDVDVKLVVPVVLPVVVPVVLPVVVSLAAFAILLDCFIGEVFKRPEDVFISIEGTTQPCVTLSRRCEALDMHVGASTP